MPGKTLVLDVWMETVGAGAAVLPSAGLAGGQPAFRALFSPGWF